MTKTWFITGASKGFGREWAEAALERGDKVAATARRLETLDALVDTYGDAVLPIQLDVTDRSTDFDAVERAADHFGTLDIVVNNAGYGHFGMVEELTEDDVRAQMETNFFGALWVTQAALPIMRAQGSGHIIQVSSIGGISAFPTVGAYHASKWALEGISQSLSQEVAGFGINVTLIEPSGYSTDWSGPSATHNQENPAYADVREAAASLGVVAGILATRIDHIFFLCTIVIQPLTFLGGVFYSAEMLPGPLRAATYADPIFYAVDVFRFAAVGVSDAPPYPTLAALVVFAAVALLGATELIRRGYKLRY